MGIEIEVDSLEDMCLLMCDNIIPQNKDRKQVEEQEDNTVDAIVTFVTNNAVIL